jgi:uncharacterized membrane protein
MADLRVKSYEIDLRSRKRASRGRGAACIDRAKADYDAASRKLNEAIAAEAVPAVQAPPSAPQPAVRTVATAPSKTVADELAKLFDLKNAGALTDDEFAAQKAKLLGS